MIKELSFLFSLQHGPNMGCYNFLSDLQSLVHQERIETAYQKIEVIQIYLVNRCLRCGTSYKKKN